MVTSRQQPEERKSTSWNFPKNSDQLRRQAALRNPQELINSVYQESANYGQGHQHIPASTTGCISRPQLRRWWLLYAKIHIHSMKERTFWDFLNTSELLRTTTALHSWIKGVINIGCDLCFSELIPYMKKREYATLSSCPPPSHTVLFPISNLATINVGLGQSPTSSTSLINDQCCPKTRSEP